MTGHPVDAWRLHPHDLIRLEPHTVHGHQVTRRTLDAEVEDVRIVGGFAVIDWREHAGFTGADPHVCGATVYECTCTVLVFGGAA